MTIGFIGNPNCGKTTLFNAYTGANLKVANWPGVTVEKKEGAMKYHDQLYKLVDLPGTYSLTSYSLEEIVARDFILSDDVDIIINVVDASALERNLYLTLQLIELGKPVVMALNMMDIIEKRGMEIDLHRLPEMLGIPIIPVSGRKKRGLDVLLHAIAHHGEETPQQIFKHTKPDGTIVKLSCPLTYSDEIERKITLVTAELKTKYPDMKNYRWHAIKLLEKDEAVSEKYAVNPVLTKKSYETEITNQKYEFIESVIEEVLVNKEKRQLMSDKIDAVLTHGIWGLPIFLLMMGLIFFLTFTLGDWLKGYFEMGLEIVAEAAQNLLNTLNVNQVLQSLILDGIISGVGGILTFTPNIFILFIMLALLEDSGYMSRVAYVMNGIMGKLGVSGKAFIPMLLGFGCSVPAVMATRSLENHKDRFKMMMIIPFMSCSAKLPIYVLFSGIFFPNHSIIVSYSLYILGFIVGLITALIARLFDKRKEENNLLIELPDYKAPSAETILIYVWEKIKDYLSRAGSIILIASIFMWFILNFGFSGYTQDISESFGALFGRYLVPVLKPIGLGFWQAGVALISGLTAKEVVVASFSVLFGIANINSAEGISEFTTALSQINFTALNAYTLMVFSLLYPPCIAALATIKRETQSWRKLGFTAVVQIGAAWIVSFIVYQVGSLFI